MSACHRRWIGFVFGALMLAAPLSVGASLIVKMTLEEMAVASDIVVVGTVRSATGFWNAARTHILTRVVVDVEEAAKGSAPPVIEVVELGGTLDGITVWIPGTPQFQPGEQAVLFLNRDPGDGEWKVSGFAQGKFRIFQDQVTGQRLVRHAEPLRQVYDSRLGKAVRADPMAPVLLAEFLEHVRRLAEGGRGNAR